jgi:hypothetical protein
MADPFAAFCGDCRAALIGDNGRHGREAVRRNLERLLADSGFVAGRLLPLPPGRHALYQDADLGFVVLAHVLDEAMEAPPHDHGDSWAVYGQVTRHTDVSEWSRVDDGRGAGSAELVPTRRYRLEPGQAGLFEPGAIHAIEMPADTRYMRVTGTDLDRIPRLMFDTVRHLAMPIHDD